MNPVMWRSTNCLQRHTYLLLCLLCIISQAEWGIRSALVRLVVNKSTMVCVHGESVIHLLHCLHSSMKKSDINEWGLVLTYTVHLTLIVQQYPCLVSELPLAAPWFNIYAFWLCTFKVQHIYTTYIHHTGPLGCITKGAMCLTTGNDGSVA